MSKNEGHPIKYEIRHNRVKEVEKFIDDEDGITSDGLDSLGNNVFVKNLDAGKSKELMRVVLEGDYEEGRSRRRLIIILLSISSLVAMVVLYFMFFSGDEKEIESNTKVGDTIISGFPLGEVSENNSEIVVDPVIENTSDEIFEAPKENDFEIQSLKLENTRLNFEYETLRKEHISGIDEKSSLISKNNNLESINSDLESQISELNKEIARLEVDLIKNENSPKNSPSEEFMCYLGGEVYKKCEKAESDGQNNGCKDLYYNFLKNE